MKKNNFLKPLLLCLTCLGTSPVLAASPTYAIDSSGSVVRDGQGECVHVLNGRDFPECRGEMITQAPTDSDNDGISDAKDRCPGTAAGVRVDANGCPQVSDADRDGIADNQDRCPGTPANVTVDAVGCPLDKDGDGIADYLDQCPNTPVGSTVDGKGCPQKIVVKDLNFRHDSAVLTDESQAILDTVVAGIKGNPAVRQITVTGYTDSQGEADYNKSLSERRAKAVADYLSSKGLTGLSINSTGMGEENPIASNTTKEGRAENRRVEIDLK